MTIGSRNSHDMHWFPGAIDQVRVYSRALAAADIRDQYLYESAWVEDRQTQDITVDGDLPTAGLLVDSESYMAKQPVVVGMTASDPTSGVARMRLSGQCAAGPCGSHAFSEEAVPCS
jgi:hypothetical protein